MNRKNWKFTVEYLDKRCPQDLCLDDRFFGHILLLVEYADIRIRL